MWAEDRAACCAARVLRRDLRRTIDGGRGSRAGYPLTSPHRWHGQVTTGVVMSTSKDPYVVDDVALPVENPWRRNVRPGDVQFLADGTGVLITLDGDVWLGEGLARQGRRRHLAQVHVRPARAAHARDPRRPDLGAFDRNGIWRLRDTNADGEADVHELFSNAFAQTADMREFPSSIRLAPGGDFVIAKGGQEDDDWQAQWERPADLGGWAHGHRARLRLRRREHPHGLITSSDQQGHYIPSTPCTSSATGSSTASSATSCRARSTRRRLPSR